jgi:hypothetical protein
MLLNSPYSPSLSRIPFQSYMLPDDTLSPFFNTPPTNSRSCSVSFMWYTTLRISTSKYYQYSQKRKQFTETHNREFRNSRAFILLLHYFMYKRGFRKSFYIWNFFEGAFWSDSGIDRYMITSKLLDRIFDVWEPESPCWRSHWTCSRTFILWGCVQKV